MQLLIRNTFDGRGLIVTDRSAVGAALAGWYPDPSRRYEFRYWDGANWTPHVCTGDRRYVDAPPSAPAHSTGSVQSPMIVAIALAVMFGLFGVNRVSGQLVSTPWDTANLVRDVICVFGWSAVAVGLFLRRDWAATFGAWLGLGLVAYSLAFIAQAPANPALWIVALTFATLFGAAGLMMLRVRSRQV